MDNLFSRESNRSSFPKPFYDLFGVNEKQRICCSQVRPLFMYQLTHFDVRDEALILKKVAFDWLAIHLPEINIYLSLLTKALPTIIKLILFQPLRENFSLKTPTKFQAIAYIGIWNH